MKTILCIKDPLNCSVCFDFSGFGKKLLSKRLWNLQEYTLDIYKIQNITWEHVWKENLSLHLQVSWNLTSAISKMRERKTQLQIIRPTSEVGPKKIHYASIANYYISASSNKAAFLYLMHKCLCWSYKTCTMYYLVWFLGDWVKWE